MKNKTLLEMPLGKECQIVACKNPLKPASYRLLELGLVPGTFVRILRKAPLKGALLVELSLARICIGTTLAREFLATEAF